MITTYLFFGFALLAVLGALGLILFKHPMNELAQTTLRYTADITVDGNNALDVNGVGDILFFAQHLELGLINHQPVLCFLDLAINHHFMTRGHQLVNETHVEPAAGDSAGAKHTTRLIHNDGFIEASSTKAPQ